MQNKMKIPKRSRLLLCGLFIIIGAALFAEAPVAIAAPKRARSRIVEAAKTYLGTPYLYGGTTGRGLDCSGFVYRVYIDSFGVAPLASLPRSASALFSFVEAIDRKNLQPGDLVFFDTTGGVSHVGIYEGEGRFIHAASEGPSTGVIESQLAEKYWSAHYAGAGRLIPPAEYLGILLTASLGASLGSGQIYRGVEASCEASYRLGFFEAGLELRPSYDAALGVFRLPIVLSVSFERHLRFFAGPALTFGSPSLSVGGEARAYNAEGDYVATAGIVWTPLKVKIAGLDTGLYLDAVYDHYVSAAAGDLGADLAVRVRFGAGLSVGWSF
jgi:probable lipoprotein NlpC